MHKSANLIISFGCVILLSGCECRRQSPNETGEAMIKHYSGRFFDDLNSLKLSQRHPVYSFMKKNGFRYQVDFDMISEDIWEEYAENAYL